MPAFCICVNGMTKNASAAPGISQQVSAEKNRRPLTYVEESSHCVTHSRIRVRSLNLQHHQVVRFEIRGPWTPGLRLNDSCRINLSSINRLDGCPWICHTCCKGVPMILLRLMPAYMWMKYHLPSISRAFHTSCEELAEVQDSRDELLLSTVARWRKEYSRVNNVLPLWLQLQACNSTSPGQFKQLQPGQQGFINNFTELGNNKLSSFHLHYCHQCYKLYLPLRRLPCSHSPCDDRPSPDAIEFAGLLPFATRCWVTSWQRAVCCMATHDGHPRRYALSDPSSTREGENNCLWEEYLCDVMVAQNLARRRVWANIKVETRACKIDILRLALN